MIDKIYNILSPICQDSNYLIRPNTFPGISYHFFNDRPIFFGDGVENRYSTSIQIDLWDKTTVNKNIVKNIIDSMKSNGFKYASKDETYESDVNLYRTMLIFNYHYKDLE